MKRIILCAICAMWGFVAVNAQGKFGHINSAEIIQAMPEYTTSQKEIMALQRQYEKKLDELQNDVRKKMEGYQKMPANTSEAARKSQEEDIRMAQSVVQGYYENSQKTLVDEQEKKLKVIRDKILEAVQAVGKAGGYVYIMDTTQGIPYISTTLSTDVTKEVKAKLGIKK